MSSKARRMAGSQSFTVVTSTGGSKTATFTNSFPAGIYTIESISGDSDLEIYLGSADGLNVGYVTGGAKAITASAPFKYVTTANANSSDAIVFSLYTPSANATSLATKTDAYWAPPTITAVSPASLFNIDSTTTITGTNFASDAAVQFRKSDDATLVSAKQIVVGSSTSIIATRPDSFSPTDSPYDVIVTNATTGLSGSSLNAITAGSAPVWSTSVTLPAFQKTVAYSQAVVATDADTSPTVTYSQVSATLPTGITFNTSTATFSGTPSANGGSYNAVIRATDLGGNYADRTFTLAQDKPDAPGIGVATVTGETTATIAFTAPAYAGTSTITTYTATSSPAGGTGTLSQAGSGTISITGLTGSTAYTFTVTATNSSGASVASSASSSVTTQSAGILVDTLVIAGGGGNYAQYGGGGAGAGGLVYSSGNLLTYSTNHSVTVGAGGTRAANGSNSQFASLTAAIGGGYGGSQGSGTSYTGQNGGSGGGGGTGGTYYPGGTGSQGGNGGSGNSSGVGGGGGGGGAGGNGNPASGSTGGVGGAGTSTYSSWGAATLTGQNVSGTYWYAGGGGGGAFSGTPAIGGNGGGGNGVNDYGDSVTGAGRNGKPSTGGGGGGTSSGFTSSGGSGLVIARYLGSQVAIGGDVTSSGGYTYHTFTRSSNLSFGTGSSSGSKATGGIVFQDATYYYHVFNSTGTFVPSTALSSVHYLNVAGGGGGGSGRAGGGGAGGYLTNISGSAVSMVSGTTYTITVGSGGAGGTAGGSGTAGTNTSISGSGFSTITSTGGGYGGTTGAAGGAGGSGGGGGGNNDGGGSGVGGQGNSGASGLYNPSYGRSGGGGGGATTAGGTGNSPGNGGDGGAGSNSCSAFATATNTGLSGYYAGDGAGGTAQSGRVGGTGGAGGGGQGGSDYPANQTEARNGIASTGSGGGGSGSGSATYDGIAGSGGSGIVIIRYAI